MVRSRLVGLRGWKEILPPGHEELEGFSSFLTRKSFVRRASGVASFHAFDISGNISDFCKKIRMWF